MFKVGKYMSIFMFRIRVEGWKSMGKKVDF